MKEGILFRAVSDKTVEEFVEDLKKKAPAFNFGVRHVLNMGEEYRKQGVDVSEGFQLFQVIICSFERSYQTIQEDPEKAAVVLAPKQMAVYRRNGKTVIDYLPLTRDFIAQALPTKKKFQERLASTCQKIIKLIESAC